eukprot:TRINITY_DN1530_c0_g1_i8.p1 TRINITY_DN1530_c0_g1~~TRINITY_DN1530_c0_g1_i8.p1  ORF type:complete len:522 (-),score=22.88 TRINITY_DN1530_c0_g1_i8:683-2248(-)
MRTSNPAAHSGVRISARSPSPGNVPQTILYFDITLETGVVLAILTAQVLSDRSGPIALQHSGDLDVSPAHSPGGTLLGVSISFEIAAEEPGLDCAAYTEIRVLGDVTSSVQSRSGYFGCLQPPGWAGRRTGKGAFMGLWEYLDMIPLDDVTKFLTVHQDADVLNGNYGQALSYIRMFFTEHIPAAMSSPRSTEKSCIYVTRLAGEAFEKFFCGKGAHRSFEMVMEVYGNDYFHGRIGREGSVDMLKQVALRTGLRGQCIFRFSGNNFSDGCLVLDALRADEGPNEEYSALVRFVPSHRGFIIGDGKDQQNRVKVYASLNQILELNRRALPFPVKFQQQYIRNVFPEPSAVTIVAPFVERPAPVKPSTIHHEDITMVGPAIVVVQEQSPTCPPLVVAPPQAAQPGFATEQFCRDFHMIDATATTFTNAPTGVPGEAIPSTQQGTTTAPEKPMCSSCLATSALTNSNPAVEPSKPSRSTTRAKFCHNCGLKFEEVDVYCVECGTGRRVSSKHVPAVAAAEETR